MVLQTEDDGVVGRDEGAVPYCVNHILEHDIRAHRLPMGEDRLEVDLCVAVPAVQLDTAAPSYEGLSVHLHRGLSPKLLAAEVGVVGGVDVVLAQWLVHVLIARRCSAVSTVQ